MQTFTLKKISGYALTGREFIEHETGPFGSADDLMEPLRPIIDLWVAENSEELLIELTRYQRNELAAIVNNLVEFDNKKMRLRNAIEKYIQSFSTTLERNSIKHLIFPKIIRNSDNYYFEELHIDL